MLKLLTYTLSLLICVSTVGAFSTLQTETFAGDNSSIVCTENIEGSMLGIRPMVEFPLPDEPGC